MGLDCTLHVVDERSLASFVGRLLGSSSAKAPFDAKVRDGARRIDELRAALAAGDPSAGRRVTELCLRWCSAETPHLDERNFALSAWPPAHEVEPLPRALYESSLAPALGRLVDAHPALADRLDVGFDGGPSVGFFVPAAKVPALRAYLDRCLAEWPPPLRRPLRTLLQVVRVAEKKKMAYWEAADLPVEDAHDAWLRPPPRRAAAWPVATVGVLEGLRAPSFHASPALATTDALWLTDADVTWVVDLARPETSIVRVDGFYVSRAFRFGERVVGLGRFGGDPRLRLFEVPLAGPFAPRPLGALPFDVRPEALVRVGDRLLVAPATRGEPARWVDLDGSTEAAAPLVTADERAEAIALGDGDSWLAWGGRGHRVRGRAITVVREGVAPRLCHLPDVERGADGAGGVITIDALEIVRFGPDGTRTPLYPGLPRALSMAPGPGGARLVQRADDPEGSCFDVVWPDGSVTAVGPGEIGMAKPGFVLFHARRDAVLALDRARLCAIPWALVAAHPRTDVATLAAEDEAVAERERMRVRARLRAELEGKIVLDLPVPEDGFDWKGQKKKYVLEGVFAVRHPVHGLGVVTEGGLVRQPITVLFEDGVRQIVPTEP